MNNLTNLPAGKALNLFISSETYNEYLKKKDSISNIRLRPENQDFFDAMMSVDMRSTEEGRKIIEAIATLE